MENLKIGSWNILSTERIRGIDEDITHVINDRPTNINGHLKLYESRYIFIANHIIDLFNQGKLDILFIQEADSKFLEIFKTFQNFRMLCQHRVFFWRKCQAAHV